jgi:hypothetical protein
VGAHDPVSAGDAARTPGGKLPARPPAGGARGGSGGRGGLTPGAYLTPGGGAGTGPGFGVPGNPVGDAAAPAPCPTGAPGFGPPAPGGRSDLRVNGLTARGAGLCSGASGGGWAAPLDATGFPSCMLRSRLGGASVWMTWGRGHLRCNSARKRLRQTASPLEKPAPWQAAHLCLRYHSLDQLHKSRYPHGRGARPIRLRAPCVGAAAILLSAARSHHCPDLESRL